MATSTADNPVIVVGVSGATRAGKTLLVNKLHNKLMRDENFRVWKIFQDRYFLNYYDICTIPELKGLKGDSVVWDDPRALKWDKFYDDIIAVKGQFPVEDDSVKNYLLVEGFMSFYEERLRKLFDVMIWLEIDEHTCFKRRMATYPVTDKYFHSQLWTNYSSYRDLIFKKVKPKVTVIDGKQTPDEVYDAVTKLLDIKTE